MDGGKIVLTVNRISAALPMDPAVYFHSTIKTFGTTSALQLTTTVNFGVLYLQTMTKAQAGETAPVVLSHEVR
ncbi:uncharacterized protein LOC143459790 [Clavelina lepadiformis]|uniref:uncharacterized protein LOC143459790 n=1 Tax=Clavelina lepadiformis TaxID=159417 RepID=UPI0040430DCB